MPTYTTRWGLSMLGPGDVFSADGYKFSTKDIELVDRLLWYAAEGHHHTGASGTDDTPSVGPSLSLLTDGGAMPSAARYYYRYTLVDDLGNESGPSPTAAIDTPSAISSPGAPALNFITGSGTIEPGTYSYVLSAYAGASTLETKAVNSAMITVPGTSPTNEVTLLLPPLPAGATGLNVYRKSPSGMHYLWITSIASPTNGQLWIDDGSISGDCDRSLPPTNRTSNTNAVRINFPGATPFLAAGWAWRIYRSVSPTDWGRSFLVQLSPMGATPVAALSFTDVGAGTQTGSPPTVAQIINAPSKITLTNGAEVEGTLPPGMIVSSRQISFGTPGILSAGTGTFQWVCDFERADIVGVRAYLGVGAYAVATDVIVDVNVNGTSIFDNGSTRPRIVVGENSGVRAAPLHPILVAGDVVTVDVDQAGGGATPMDHDLMVNLLLYVKSGSATTSYVWT